MLCLSFVLSCVAATDPVNVIKNRMVFAPNMGGPISDEAREVACGCHVISF